MLYLPRLWHEGAVVLLLEVGHWVSDALDLAMCGNEIIWARKVTVELILQ